MKRRIFAAVILSERGQTLPLIALAMIVLLAFIGLTVDLGILLIAHGHLRRAVDSAALSASSQFREGRTITELTAAATEFIALNGVDPATVVVDTCDTDASLCTDPLRKLARVTATADVNFVFLPVVNFNSTTISANAISEAASLDVVLAIDTSDSMTSGADPATCNATDPSGTEVGGPDGDGPDGFPGECHPFEEVKEAAVSFMDGFVYAPYDRVAIVTFAQVPVLQQPITSTATITDTITLVKNLSVSPAPTVTCTFPPDPSGCTNTSIGGGLVLSGNEFAREPVRQDSLWVVILLTDGAANASVPDADGDPVNLYCPGPPWDRPYCNDGSANTRHGNVVGDAFNYFGQTHSYTPTLYDSDDYARDMADFVGCLTVTDYGGTVPHDCSTDHHVQNPPWTGGQGAVIYTIGLGPLVTSSSFGDPDAGERTLRYAAAVGDDGDPLTDPCYDPNNNHNLVTGADPDGAADDIPVWPDTIRDCGNYYYAPDSTGLVTIFESIASRIFTRLTH